MGNITQLKDKDNNNIYPISSTSVIFDKNGNSIKNLLDTKSDIHEHPYEPINSNIQTHILSQHAPSDAQKNVKSDWNEVDYNSDSFIKNKPIIPIVDVTKNYVDSQLDKKIDILGHILTDNNYTNSDKSKLENIENNANNYIHPSNHSPSIIIQDKNNRFVTDTDKNRWDNKSDAHSHPYRSNTWLPPNDHSHINKTILDSISESKISEWNNKSNFSGSYNDLINKPTSMPANGGNADTLDGKHAKDFATIITSSSKPSGNQNGRVWIQLI